MRVTYNIDGGEPNNGKLKWQWFTLCKIKTLAILNLDTFL